LSNPFNARLIVQQVGVRSASKSHGLALDGTVFAFWTLFEPHGGAGFQALAPCTRHAKVHKLPAELLLIIFKLVHPQVIIELSSKWIFTNINSPSLFAYAIATVCSHWRDIMSLVPEFWTHIVIPIDVDASTPPTTVLLWSRNLPLNVTITRVDFAHDADVHHEQDQVMSVMKILVHSHGHRSRKPRFHVMFSASLPPFPAVFKALGAI
jgi:hypothetical protein